jgi:hypothetical protein
VKRITDQNDEIIHTADTASGTIEERQGIITPLKGCLEQLDIDQKNLTELYQIIVEYHLNQRTQLSHDSLAAEILQGRKHIDLLLTQLGHELLVHT